MVTIAFHKGMTLEKWASKPVSWQVLSIVSEMARAEASLKNHLLEPFRASLERALELIDLTVDANLSNRGLMREMLRFRELLAAVYADPVLPENVDEFRSLTKVLLTLEPGAYNLLGVTF